MNKKTAKTKHREKKSMEVQEVAQCSIAEFRIPPEIMQRLLLLMFCFLTSCLTPDIHAAKYYI